MLVVNNNPESRILRMTLVLATEATHLTLRLIADLSQSAASQHRHSASYHQPAHLMLHLWLPLHTKLCLLLLLSSCKDACLPPRTHIFLQVEPLLVSSLHLTAAGIVLLCSRTDQSTAAVLVAERLAGSLPTSFSISDCVAYYQLVIVCEELSVQLGRMELHMSCLFCIYLKVTVLVLCTKITKYNSG